MELDHLSASYTDFSVLREVCIHVRDSEICAILGPNGAGKSTLLRAIMGLMPKVTGRVLLNGVEILGRPTHAVANLGIAYVPEGRGILNSLTVQENLQLAIRHRGPLYQTASERAAALDRMIARFPVLKDRLAQHAGQLSGGEQQMLAVARAVAWSPKILLVDEPSLGLAPIIRSEVAEVFKWIVAEEKISILLSEQDLKFAASCAERAYLLNLGQVEEELDTGGLRRTRRVRESYLGSAKRSRTMGKGPVE